MTDDENKISNLTTLTDIDKDEMKASIEAIKRTMPTMLEMQKCIAQIQRARYMALLEEGFSESESIELTKMGILMK